jgi:hypothetical protein
MSGPFPPAARVPGRLEMGTAGRAHARSPAGTMTAEASGAEWGASVRRALAGRFDPNAPTPAMNRRDVGRAG